MATSRGAHRRRLSAPPTRPSVDGGESMMALDGANSAAADDYFRIPLSRTTPSTPLSSITLSGGGRRRPPPGPIAIDRAARFTPLPTPSGLFSPSLAAIGIGSPTTTTSFAAFKRTTNHHRSTITAMTLSSTARKSLVIALILLSLILFGTITVLAIVKAYFGVDARDYLTLDDVAFFEAHPSKPLPHAAIGLNHSRQDDDEPQPSGDGAPTEHVPRIIHQTWIDDTLPDRWQMEREKCIEMHPDYEHVLWTDASSRAFIAEHYPWFLDTFDHYPYPIQRADAIRYFVLYHYGGVYMDLDVGCRRPLHPLLNFNIILPRTIPVGVSNDIMLASPRHPFMSLVIHHLIPFNHQYGTNYPTVMFSTGPMFLSAQYNLWDAHGQGDVRVLPKSLYGKNVPAQSAQEAFFWHFYGSSWHADDAGFITFLGKFGKWILYAGFGLVMGGALRLAWYKRYNMNTYSPNLSASSPPLLHFALPYFQWGHGPPHHSGSTPTPGVNPAYAAVPTTEPHHDVSPETGEASRSSRLYFLPLWVDPHAPPPPPSTPGPPSQSTPTKHSDGDQSPPPEYVYPRSPTPPTPPAFSTAWSSARCPDASLSLSAQATPLVDIADSTVPLPQGSPPAWDFAKGRSMSQTLDLTSLEHSPPPVDATAGAAAAAWRFQPAPVSPSLPAASSARDAAAARGSASSRGVSPSPAPRSSSRIRAQMQQSVPSGLQSPPLPPSSNMQPTTKRPER